MKTPQIALLLALCLPVAACNQERQVQKDSEDEESKQKVFSLKPGFYGALKKGQGAEFLEISNYTQRCAVRIYLSWHNGISFKDDDNLTIAQLKEKLGSAGKSKSASICLEKNYTDKNLDVEVEQLLVSLGYEEVLVTGCHSSGIILVRHRRAEQSVPPKSDRAGG